MLRFPAFKKKKRSPRKNKKEWKIKYIPPEPPKIYSPEESSERYKEYLREKEERHLEEEQKERLKEEERARNREYAKKNRERIKKWTREHNAKVKEDKTNVYKIFLTTDKKMTEQLYACEDFQDANVMFNKLIEENRESVTLPVKTMIQESHEDGSYSYRLGYPDEIILTQYIGKKDKDPVTYVMSSDGIVTTVYTKSKTRVVIRRHEWYREDRFTVRGAPEGVDGRLTAREVVDKVIYGDASIVNLKRIYVYGSTVAIKGDIRTSFIKTGDNKRAARLYNTIIDFMDRSNRAFPCGTPSEDMLRLLKRDYEMVKNL